MTTTLPAAGVIPSLFGQGLLGHAATGLIRIPAFLTAAAAAAMVGELAIRMLRSTFYAVGLEPSKESWVNTLATQITQAGIRPYAKETNEKLVGKTLLLTALAVASSEFVRVLGGPPPHVYNTVLACLGPIRISQLSYLDGLREAFKAMR